MNDMDVDTQTRNNGFALGLLTGTVLGAAAMLLLVPRAAGEARQRMTDSAKDFAVRASDQYGQVSGRLGSALEDLTAKGKGVRDGVAVAVARGAHEVERVATAAKAGPDSRQL